MMSVEQNKDLPKDWIKRRNKGGKRKWKTGEAFVWDCHTAMIVAIKEACKGDVVPIGALIQFSITEELPYGQAHDIWQRLHRRFRQESILDTAAMYKDLMALRMEPNKHPESIFDEASDLRRKYKHKKCQPQMKE